MNRSTAYVVIILFNLVGHLICPRTIPVIPRIIIMAALSALFALGIDACCNDARRRNS